MCVRMLQKYLTVVAGLLLSAGAVASDPYAGIVSRVNWAVNLIPDVEAVGAAIVSVWVIWRGIQWLYEMLDEHEVAEQDYQVHRIEAIADAHPEISGEEWALMTDEEVDEMWEEMCEDAGEAKDEPGV